MSYAMRVSKAYAQGDPGLLGILGGIAKGVVGAATGLVTGGPAGAIIGGIRAVLPTKQSTSIPQVLVRSSPIPGTTLTAGNIPGLPSLPGIGTPGISIGGPKGINIGPGAPGSLYPVGPVQGPSSGALVGTGQHTPCARGYHYNRTGYWTKRYGYIEKGSVCVKNRRRNPLNPRALSRAMSRLSSAKKAASCLSRFTVREAGCGCGGRKR